MRLGKEEAVGYVEDTLEDTTLENGAAARLATPEIHADHPQQPATPAPQPLRVG
jgi:hypothetical protein